MAVGGDLLPIGLVKPNSKFYAGSQMDDDAECVDDVMMN